MFRKASLGMAAAGLCAGVVNGLMGAGGGMVLVPLLLLLTDTQENAIFPSSISIMLPICLISLLRGGLDAGLPWLEAAPYLLGSAAGGVLAGLFGQKIPVSWLHKLLGALILWGGVRYLW